MKLNTLLIICVCGIFLQLLCCKKKDNPTRRDFLIGKWERVGEGFDRNGNGILDSNEETALVGSYFIFSKDGTGEVVSDSNIVEYPFSWQLLQNDSILEFKVNTTISDHAIDSLNASTLVYRYFTSPMITWGIYVRK